MVTPTVRPSRGPFEAATTFGPTQNGTAALSFDSFGDGIASWTGLVDGTGVTFAANYDAAPPVVTQLTVRA